MLKTGLIGLGKWGKRLLPKLVSNSKVLICSNEKSRESRKWLQQSFPEIKHTFDYNEIISNNLIDTVFITTPIESHYKIALEALNSGKNVFVEKPLSKDTKEVKSLFELASTKSLNLYVGYVFTTSKITSYLKSVNATDPIKQIRMNWLKYGTFKEKLFENLLSHELSIVYSILQTNLKNIDIVDSKKTVHGIDSVNINLELVDSQEISININRVSNNYCKESIIKTVSGKEYNWIGDELFSGQDKSKLLVKDYKDKLEMQISNFLTNTDNGIQEYQKELNIFVSEIITILYEIQVSN